MINKKLLDLENKSLDGANNSTNKEESNEDTKSIYSYDESSKERYDAISEILRDYETDEELDKYFDEKFKIMENIYSYRKCALELLEINTSDESAFKSLLWCANNGDVESLDIIEKYYNSQNEFAKNALIEYRKTKAYSMLDKDRNSEEAFKLLIWCAGKGDDSSKFFIEEEVNIRKNPVLIKLSTAIKKDQALKKIKNNNFNKEAFELLLWCAENNNQDAKEELEKKANDEGNHVAQNALADYYLHKARDASRKLLALGNKTDSEYNNALSFIKQDMEIAESLYKKSAAQNNVDALLRLGVLYYKGINCKHIDQENLIKTNIALAFDFLEKSSQKENIKACYFLANLIIDCLEQKKSIPGKEISYTMAKNLFAKAAENDLAEAQYNLGIIYNKGAGEVKKNLIEAVKWFCKAAENGVAQAQYNLGVIYSRNNDGIEKNLHESMKWLRKSADQNYNSAKKLLSELNKQEQKAIKSRDVVVDSDTTVKPKSNAQQNKSIKKRELAKVITPYNRSKKFKKE